MKTQSLKQRWIYRCCKHKSHMSYFTLQSSSSGALGLITNTYLKKIHKAPYSQLCFRVVQRQKQTWDLFFFFVWVDTGADTNGSIPYVLTSMFGWRESILKTGSTHANCAWTLACRHCVHAGSDHLCDSITKLNYIIRVFTCFWFKTEENIFCRSVFRSSLLILLSLCKSWPLTASVSTLLILMLILLGTGLETRLLLMKNLWKKSQERFTGSCTFDTNH